MSRSCNGCTKCCEGYLTGEAKTIKFYQGKPCHFKSCSGCSIYSQRPKLCKDFMCAWRDDKEHILPEWFFPKDSEVLIVRRNYAPNKDFLQIYEAGRVLEAKVLSWLIMYYFNGGLPLAYQIENGWNYIGPKDFIEYTQTLGATASSM